ncbi:lysine transporter LysE, partial [Pseudomonas syringae pv. actinidiae]
MNLATLALFLPACFALNMAPGPNNLLSISNATRYGYRTSCMAGIGRLLAFALMIALASAGLAVVLQTSELIFYGVKIVGAAYLFYLAYQLWRAAPQTEAESKKAPLNLFALAKQEFLVAAGNPKAILIFTAFLPQFVDPTVDVASQFTLLGLLF